MAADIGEFSTWSTTAASNQPDSSDSVINIDDNLRQIQATIRKYLGTKGSDIASAATVDLSTATGNCIHVTGSTGPITSFGTVSAGVQMTLVFDSTPTITHSATALILPGAADIVAEAGDRAGLVSLGSGNWRCLWYQRASGKSTEVDFVSVKDYGAVGDGVTDDTTAFTNAINASNVVVIPGMTSENYIVTVGSLPVDKNNVFISNGAQINGVDIIPIQIGVLYPYTGNTFRIFHDTNVVSGINTVTYIKRDVNADESAANPKALRVQTDVNVDTAQTEWAISGELNNYSDTASTGNTAVSGTGKKYGAGSVFSGHFNSSDMQSYDNYADVTAVVGIEAHARGIGLDHQTANNGLGKRLSIDIAAGTSNAEPTWNEWAGSTTYAAGDHIVPVGTTFAELYIGFYYVCTTAGDSSGTEPTWPTTIGDTVTDGTAVWTAYKGAENGCAIRVHNGDTDSWAYYRWGVAIEDDIGGSNTNVMRGAINIRTNGDYGIYMPSGTARTTADIYLDADSDYGLSCTGAYTYGAIRVGSDQRVVLSNSGTGSSSVYMVHNSSENKIEFYKGSSRVGYIDLAGADHAL